jgi:hypothetical protein
MGAVTVINNPRSNQNDDASEPIGFDEATGVRKAMSIDDMMRIESRMS